MKNNLVNNTLSAIAALALVAVLLATNIELMTCTFGNQWFRHEFDKYSVLEDVRGEMSMDAATGVMSDIMDYMLGRSDDINVIAEVDGQQVEFLSPDCQQHLTDCRGIVDVLKIIRVAAVIVFILMVIYIKKCAELRLRGIIYAIVAAVALAGAVVAACGGFHGAFWLFHKLCFDNDLWLLDPNIDNLINLLPEGFFKDTAVVASLASLAEAFIVFVGIKHI